MKLKKQITIVALLITSCTALGQNKKTEAEFKKMCSEIANAFAKKNIFAINKYINSQTGVYIITRPGAIDVFSNEKKLDVKNPIKPTYPFSDTSSVKKHVIKYGLAPKFDCGTMKWNQVGFVADSSTKYNRISDIMDFRTKYENEKYTKEDSIKKDSVEKHIRKVVFTEIAKNHGLVFYLSFLNGKWYLTIVDTVEGSCGA